MQLYTDITPIEVKSTLFRKNDLVFIDSCKYEIKQKVLIVIPEFDQKFQIRGGIIQRIKQKRSRNFRYRVRYTNLALEQKEKLLLWLLEN